MRFKQLWNLLLTRIKEFNDNTKKSNGGRYVRAWADYILCAVILGAAPSDYYKYKFHEKSWKERNTFITFRRSRKLIKENGINAEAMVEKNVINKRLAEFINRDWLEIETATEQEFSDFLDIHDGKAFMKPLGSTRGEGIFLMTKEAFEESGQNLTPYRNYIAEEVIVQNSKLSELYPSSVNSVRVMTYRGEVLLSTLKLGTGNAIVDNLHANGINGNVDVKTGMTNAPFIDRHFNEYSIHPTTGKKLIGIQLPNWDILLDKVRRAAALLPELPYLGWDMAITENDVAVIEVNDEPGHYISQGSAQIGVYAEIKRIKKKNI